MPVGTEAEQRDVRLFQNPRNKRQANNHSDTPRNHLPPRMPNTGYIQKMSGPLVMYITPPADVDAVVASKPVAWMIYDGASCNPVTPPRHVAKQDQERCANTR
jgi:hypothetical protein